MKKRILFVDDDQAVLELFRLMFKAMGGDWEIYFANSGLEALAQMEKCPFDIVVSDMRMPGMSGAQLLNEVMQRYPKTARIILSGYAEQESVAKCIGATHQFLMKPCDVASLKATLTRVCTLDEFLSNEKLKALVARMEVLPSLPSLYFKILQELQSPFASIDRIGEIVALDPGMTAKVLQMVNSAFFGISRKISDPTEAVQMLGVGTVRSLAISIHAFSCFDQAKLAEFSFERLWDHSVVTGLFARKIAHSRGLDKAMEDEAFIAGLLHDIGKLMMISNVMEPYRSALLLAREKRITMWEAEQDVFGATHADVGAYLLGLWGLPIPVVEAVALHHCPARNVSWEFSPLTAVHVANVLEHERSSVVFDGAPSELDEHYLTELGLWEEVPGWREVLNRSLEPRDS